MNSSEPLLNQNSTENHDMNLENHHSYVRKRTRATAEQLAVLEDTFAVNVSPNSKLRKQLAEQLNMSERSIQIWFQNRRAKVKHMQKRAQMQMQQAAMRAQLYHYHQQQYGMMSAYGAPAPPAPMLPLQPSLYSHHPQTQPSAATTAQQPFYFPPAAYMRRIPPLPRAQSVDAVTYYGSPSADLTAARSSFPTPGPEPFMSHDSLTPPPHMAHHHHQAQPYPSSTTTTPGGTWSVPPNYPIDSPIKLSRQSMPPHYNPLSHTLVDDMLPSSQTDFSTAIAHSMDNNGSNDFPDFVHGQMSPSPSPNRDDLQTTASYFSPSVAGTTKGPLSSSSLHIESSKSTTTDSFDGKLTEEPAALTETDMWISSPNIENRSESLVEGVTSCNSTVPPVVETTSPSSSEEEATVNPSNLIMTNDSTTTNNEEPNRPQQENQFNVTTLTIGTWHRLKLQSSDLVCQYQADQRTFMWYITEGGSRFKVKVPATHLVSIEFTPSLGTNGEPTSDIHFYLTQPPLFYMEKPNEKEWIQCSDFTENKQASRYLRHTLKGPELKQDLVQLMSEREELRRFIRFLDDPQAATASTPFLPSQQQQQTASIIVPSAMNYYPYYYYPSTTAASMPLSLAASNPPAMITSSEPPVPCGGFYP
ncbi:MAG: hypothetical protein EXX96DRAFT_650406 [Benjaminiella poitrasii]|nr:MAG: hypothetical protein EXX96DRAFT_650406 [Benjaminiella poitrasii]